MNSRPWWTRIIRTGQGLLVLSGIIMVGITVVFFADRNGKPMDGIISVCLALGLLVAAAILEAIIAVFEIASGRVEPEPPNKRTGPPPPMQRNNASPPPPRRDDHIAAEEQKRFHQG